MEAKPEPEPDPEAPEQEESPSPRAWNASAIPPGAYTAPPEFEARQEPTSSAGKILAAVAALSVVLGGSYYLERVSSPARGEPAASVEAMQNPGTAMPAGENPAAATRAEQPVDSTRFIDAGGLKEPIPTVPTIQITEAPPEPLVAPTQAATSNYYRQIHLSGHLSGLPEHQTSSAFMNAGAAQASPQAKEEASPIQKQAAAPAAQRTARVPLARRSPFASRSFGGGTSAQQAAAPTIPQAEPSRQAEGRIGFLNVGIPHPEQIDGRSAEVQIDGRAVGRVGISANGHAIVPLRLGIPHDVIMAFSRNGQPSTTRVQVDENGTSTGYLESASRRSAAVTVPMGVTGNMNLGY